MKSVMISWIVCVLGLVLLLVWVGNDMVLKGAKADADGVALVKAEFTLQTKNSKVVSASDLRGKYLLVFFGFTHCPDICPTTLLLVNNVLTQMDDAGKNIQPIFISVDPERDTPDKAAEYASHFGPRMLGLSGTPEQVKVAADSFKVYYSKVEDKSSALGYVVDHSGFLYLMGPDGAYVAHFPSTVSEAELRKELMHYVH